MTSKQLRNSILQLAIQGKLVEQRAGEGTAEDLYSQIQHEKELLIKEKKIKKAKPLPEIMDDEIPFDIPLTWKWVRLGECLFNKSGVGYKKDNLDVFPKSPIRVLRGGNINELSYIFKSDDIVLDKDFVKTELLLRKNTLITPAVTSLEHIGKMARIDKDFDNVAVGGFVLMLIQYIDSDIFSKYLLFILSSAHHRNICKTICNKSGQAFYNMSRNKLMEIIIPLSPLEEQKRIVEKIEQLLKYCNELK